MPASEQMTLYRPGSSVRGDGAKVWAGRPQLRRRRADQLAPATPGPRHFRDRHKRAARSVVASATRGARPDCRDDEQTRRWSRHALRWSPKRGPVRSGAGGGTRYRIRGRHGSAPCTTAEANSTGVRPRPRRGRADLGKTSARPSHRGPAVHASALVNARSRNLHRDARDSATGSYWPSPPSQANAAGAARMTGVNKPGYAPPGRVAQLTPGRPARQRGSGQAHGDAGGDRGQVRVGTRCERLADPCPG
jgi:hypothetical protein